MLTRFDKVNILCIFTSEKSNLKQINATCGIAENYFSLQNFIKMVEISQELQSLRNGQMEFREQLKFIRKMLIKQQKEKYLSINEACDYASISRSKLLIIRNEGLLKSYRIRGTVLIKRSELDTLIESMADNHEPQRA